MQKILTDFKTERFTYPCNHDDGQPEKKDDDKRSLVYSSTDAGCGQDFSALQSSSFKIQ
jgi:hypothetical protein